MARVVNVFFVIVYLKTQIIFATRFSSLQQHAASTEVRLARPAQAARPGDRQVFVKDLKGKNFTFAFTSESNWGDVFMFIKDKTAIPPTMYQLKLPQGSKVGGEFVSWSNHKEIGVAEAGIKNADTVKMTMRVRGGLAHADATDSYGYFANGVEVWGRYDFVARLKYYDREEWIETGETPYCTGTVYGDVVVTAAHCFQEKPDLKKWTVKTFDGTRHLILRVKYVGTKDLAIGQLSGSYTPTMKPVLDSRDHGRASLTIAGFGENENNYKWKTGKLLSASEVPLRATCRIPGEAQASLKPSQLCADKSPSGSITCGGDSGAPYFWIDADGIVHIIGVHNGAFAPNTKKVRKCGDHDVMYYTAFQKCSDQELTGLARLTELEILNA